VYTHIGNPGKPIPAGTYDSLAFNSSNVLYGVNIDSGQTGTGNTHLVTINTATATGTDVGQSVVGLDAIAFTPVGTTASNVTISGRVVSGTGAGMRGAFVTIVDSRGNKLTAATNAFGYYTFASVPSGDTYIANAAARGLTFGTRVVTVNDAVAGLDFSPQ
jgi:hypothetical protein